MSSIFIKRYVFVVGVLWSLICLLVETGRKLGVNVIAEGVENETQRNLLVAMGCHAIQGFLFSRPLDFEAFCSWCEAHPPA